MYAFSRLENEMSELYFDFFSFLSLFQKKKKMIFTMNAPMDWYESALHEASSCLASP